MTLIEFLDCLERNHPQNLEREKVLLEMIDNFIAHNAKNPLKSKMGSVKKILNPNSPRPIPKADADYIFCNRDLKRFEKYMNRYLKNERSKKFLEEEMDRYGRPFNSDQVESEPLERTYAYELEDIINEFRNLKQSRNKKSKAIEIQISDGDINSRLEDVVNKLSELPTQKSLKIEPYNVKRIKEKINPNEMARLYDKVIWNVGDYFDVVKNLFIERQKSPDVIYDAIKEKVHEHYLKLKGRSQKEVFEKMVEWLMNDTFADREVCEIVVSYFIRTCEVFDAVAK